MNDSPCDAELQLVRDLLQEQFPQWSGLRVARVPSYGTDNSIFRLGHALSVRLPRTASAAAQIDKEARWLPKLSMRTPLPIPVPLAVGCPSKAFAHSWSVCRWIEGADATSAAFADEVIAANDLARFLLALHGCDTAQAPGPGEHNFHRGVPLASRDRRTRDAIDRLSQLGEIDGDLARAVWELSMAADRLTSPPVWIHGDLHPANLLVHGGRICGVLDFGGLAAGDPACDLMAGWTLFTAKGRQAFRNALACDAATWSRARGWALSFGVIALDYYQNSNAGLASIARTTIQQVLSVEGAVDMHTGAIKARRT